MAIAPVNKFVSIAVPVSPGGLQKLYEVPTGTSALLLYTQVSNVGIGVTYPKVTFVQRRESRGTGNTRDIRVIKDVEIPPNDAVILIDGRLVLEKTPKVIDRIYVTGSQENVNIETVLAKYTADVLWSNTLRIRFARQFASLDKNAEKEQQKIKQSFSEPQIKLSEIILLATPQRNLEQTQAMAQEIVKAARQGASFSGIAQQYSAAGSASRGGDVGWLFIERLPDAFKAPLMAAKDGDILEPVTQSGQVYIFKREELREQGLLDPKATIVTLARAVDELAEDVSNDQIQSRSKALTEKTASLNSCNQIEALNAELGSDVQSVIRDLALSDLSPQLQRQIISLEVNEPSQPLKFAEGLVVFMVCERKLPELDLPSLESLKQRELERIMTSLSGRFLLRLQRNARIELK